MSTAKCYSWDAAGKKPSQVDPRFDQPCPSGGGCCLPGDTCVGNFMCKHKEPATDPNRPDYYISACTDSTYSSAACVKYCSKFGRTGVVYNTTTDQWACCGTTGTGANIKTTCATPSDVTFSLVPPNQLPIIGIAGIPASSSTVSSVVASSSSASSSETSTSTTSSPTSSSTAPSTSGSNLVPPAQGMSSTSRVGLGVGLGIGAAIIIAAVVLLLFRRRQRSNRANDVRRPSMVRMVESNSLDTPPRIDTPASFPFKSLKGASAQDVDRPHGVHELDNTSRVFGELSHDPFMRRHELP